MISPVRLSVFLSVTITRVDQSKTVEVRLSSQSSPIPLVLWYKYNPEILTGSPMSSGVKQGWGGENKPFSIALCVDT